MQKVGRFLSYETYGSNQYGKPNIDIHTDFGVWRPPANSDWRNKLKFMRRNDVVAVETSFGNRISSIELL